MKTSKHLSLNEKVWESVEDLVRYLSYIEKSKITTTEIVRRSLDLYLSVYAEELTKELPDLDYLGYVKSLGNKVQSLDVQFSEERRSRYSKIAKIKTD